ncbi:MAG TPA: hypothetical protein VK590_12565 [Saprospiraceae bacterium]|nr:hypothetical protein [Saprospiraceae bacterium]
MTNTKQYTLITIYTILLFTFLHLGCKKDQDLNPASGTDIGIMTIDPGQVISGQYVDMTIQFTVNPDVKLADTIAEVTLIQIDPSGSKTDLATLYDNGDLIKFDEIKGDKVFSNQISYYSDKAGDYQFLISVKIIDGNGNTKEIESTSFKFTVYEDLKAGEFNDVMLTQYNGANEFKTQVASNVNNVLSAVDKTISWLKTQDNVQDAVKSSAGIAITYKSGIKASLTISVEDQNGGMTLGGLGKDSFPNRNRQFLPLSEQTRGTTKNIILTRGEDIAANLIGNRKVLIFEPYESVLKGLTGPSKTEIMKIFNEDKCAKYEVDDIANSDANIDAVSGFTQYGFVLIYTHGHDGQEFGTGEQVDESTFKFADKYKAMLRAIKLTIMKNIQVTKTGDVIITKDVYAITPSFINDLSGKFPNSHVM